MFPANQLIAEINRRGIHFLAGESAGNDLEKLSPAELMAGLASNADARIRLALVAVLLQHPQYAVDAHEAMELLNNQNRLTFQLYYTAAHFLQIIYRDKLQQTLESFQCLPDLFSRDLGIKKIGSPEESLKELASRHNEISGLPLNWYGTYHYAAKRVLTRLEKERQWAAV